MLTATVLTPSTSSVINVLVVDDEEPVVRFVDRVLRGAGYVTTRALGGQEALNAASKLVTVDLLVTDMMMPNITGDELARKLRMKVPTLKVLYLTGYSDCLFKQKPMLWEDEAFLDKPCSITGLLQAVSLLLFGRFQSVADPGPVPSAL